jgi:predicted dehydrogenase
MASLRIGIVGTGNMAHSHAQNYQKMAGVELASCLDIQADRAADFARAYRIPHVAASLPELLEQVDAVAVVTPDRQHAEITIAALEAGKHVLCEKPLAVTLAEARRVAEAAAASKAIHLVNFSYRSSAAMQKAMQWAKDGRLGHLRHVHAWYLQSWLASADWSVERLQWRLKTSAGSGGVLGDLGCHILDLTTAVAGEVSRIRCDLRTFPKISAKGAVTHWDGEALDANDTAIIELEFAGGGIGLVHTTRWASGHGNHLRLELHGTEGALMLDLDQDYHKLNHCLGEDRRRSAWSTDALEPTPNPYERFVRAIQTGVPDQPDLLRGAQIQAYLDACERSAVSGNWEPVLPWLPPY